MADVNLVVQSTLNITCLRNDTFSLDMDWTNSNSEPIDLTIYEFRAQVKKSKAASTAVLTFEDEDFSRDADGNLVMSKSASNMNIVAGVYQYDLQTTSPSGTIATWLAGKFIIQEDVTD